jgi:hypothetical protein
MYEPVCADLAATAENAAHPIIFSFSTIQIVNDANVYHPNLSIQEPKFQI